MPASDERWVFRVGHDGLTNIRNCADPHMCFTRGAGSSVTLHIERENGLNPMAVRIGGVEAIPTDRKGGSIIAKRLELTHGLKVKGELFVNKDTMTIDILDKDGNFAFCARREDGDKRRPFLLPVVRADI